MTEHSIRSDVAGRIWQLAKAEGETVQAEEPIVIVEAMKMEIPVAADRAGRLVRLLVGEGDEVAEDQVVAIVSTDG